MNRIKTLITIDKDLLARVKEVIKPLGLSFSSVVETMLLNFVEFMGARDNPKKQEEIKDKFASEIDFKQDQLDRLKKVKEGVGKKR